MNELALRLSALDPEAGAAVQAVTHFDALTEARAGLQSIVRGAAALAGCPARLTDPSRGLVVRVLANGVVQDPPADEQVDQEWPAADVGGIGVVLLLEQPGPPGTVQAVVLERAAAAARSVLLRTRPRPRDVAATVDVVLDAAIPEADRIAAARRLRVRTPARAVALPAGRFLLVPGDGGVTAGVRAGVGPAVDIIDLPRSAALARLALRLTAEGTERDPGPRIVHADHLGSLAPLVRAAEGAELPDVRALERASTNGPWILSTLDAIAGTASLRDAARVLHVHHSTVQDRLHHAEQALGWEVRSVDGRLRLQLALILRRAGRKA